MLNCIAVAVRGSPRWSHEVRGDVNFCVGVEGDVAMVITIFPGVSACCGGDSAAAIKGPALGWVEACLWWPPDHAHMGMVGMA